MARRKVDVLTMPLSPCCGDYKHPPHDFCELCPVKPRHGDKHCEGCGYYTCECPDRSRRNDSVLDEAAGIVHGARQAAYGHPRDNHSCTAALWTAYLRRCGVLKDDAEITARQVCIANILQKASRDAHSPERDNLVDISGFAQNAEMVDE